MKNLDKWVAAILYFGAVASGIAAAISDPWLWIFSGVCVTTATMILINSSKK